MSYDDDDDGFIDTCLILSNLCTSLYCQLWESVVFLCSGKFDVMAPHVGPDQSIFPLIPSLPHRLLYLFSIFRPTLRPNIAGLKCPYFHLYVRPQKRFFYFNEILHVGRGR